MTKKNEEMYQQVLMKQEDKNKAARDRQTYHLEELIYRFEA